MKKDNFVLILAVLGVLIAKPSVGQTPLEVLEKQCGKEQLLKEWRPTKAIGSGFQTTVYEVCNISNNNCNYALKIGSAAEANFSEKMGGIGIGPKVPKTYACGPKTAIVMEKMDGDLNKLFYPLKTLTATTRGTVILPQVLDLIFDSLKNGVCQNDAKLANFLYKKEGESYKLYLADYGIAKDCPQYSKDNLDSAIPPMGDALIRQLGVFVYSYFKPWEYGGPLGVKSTESEKEEFMHSLHAAIKWNKKWTKYVKDGAESLPYGQYLRFVTVVDKAGKKITDVQNYTGKTTWGDVLKVVKAKLRLSGKIIYQNKEVKPDETLPTAYPAGSSKIEATFSP